MIINNNISAASASRTLKVREGSLSQAITRLSTGKRINSGADDPAGLAVSEKMRNQISGLKTASKNASDAIAFIQTTEGYLQETHDILNRVRELSIQAGNGIYTAEDRMMIQTEVSQLLSEVNRVASHAQFNGMNMLTGRFARNVEGTGVGATSMWFHIGANIDQRIQVYVGTMTLDGLGVRNLSLSSVGTANLSLGRIDQAIAKVTHQRSNLGAFQTRLDKLIEGVDIAAENMLAAESQIRDADMAEEMVKYAKEQILRQATVSMLAQANAKSQGVLRLLG